MPRKSNSTFLQKNRIKKAVINGGISQRLVSLWLDVKYNTVSSWNSNSSQPADQNLNMIGELLEVDNRELMEPQGRINTGLAKALEAELKRLHKEEGLPYEIEKLDKTKNIKIKVNNPELIKKLKAFGNKYRLKDGS